MKGTEAGIEEFCVGVGADRIVHNVEFSWFCGDVGEEVHHDDASGAKSPGALDATHNCWVVLRFVSY
jgi:hypothetical protein